MNRGIILLSLLFVPLGTLVISLSRFQVSQPNVSTDHSGVSYSLSFRSSWFHPDQRCFIVQFYSNTYRDIVSWLDRFWFSNRGCDRHETSKGSQCCKTKGRSPGDDLLTWLSTSSFVVISLDFLVHYLYMHSRRPSTHWNNSVFIRGSNSSVRCTDWTNEIEHPPMHTNTTYCSVVSAWYNCM